MRILDSSTDIGREFRTPLIPRKTTNYSRIHLKIFITFHHFTLSKQRPENSSYKLQVLGIYWKYFIINYANSSDINEMGRNNYANLSDMNE